MDIKVTKMKCDGCVSAVKSALESIDGVSDVTVDLAAGMVHLTGDDQKIQEAVIQKLITAGYPPALN